MTLIKLLEVLANNAHFHLNIEELLKDQSHDIRQAFLENNSKALKNQFNDSATIIANRSNIVRVTKE